MIEMIEVKTAELDGPVLRWAVVMALGGTFKAEHAPLEGKEYQRVCLPGGYDDHGVWFESAHPAWAGTMGTSIWRPDVDWSQGGPLIDGYAIEFEWVTDATIRAFAMIDSGVGFGSSHLIAACRAIVAATLGDTVAIPAELI